MNKYEIMFIVKATIESDEVKATCENYKKLFTDMKANIVDFKEMGEKKLAYEIDKNINGYYFVMQVEADPAAVKEFDRKSRIDEKMIRHLIIKLDEE